MKFRPKLIHKRDYIRRYLVTSYLNPVAGKAALSRFNFLLLINFLNSSVTSSWSRFDATVSAEIY
jgi:hypothetical protein